MISEKLESVFHFSFFTIHFFSCCDDPEVLIDAKNTEDE